MPNRKALFLAALCLCTPLITAQSNSSSPPQESATSDPALRSRMLSALPRFLLEKWRKFGQWDYKQVGFEYRDYTQFNFGATGSAAKIDEKSLMQLVRAFRPTPEDVKRLADSDLEPNFARNTRPFEHLL